MARREGKGKRPGGGWSLVRVYINMITSYSERNIILQQMGFVNYSDYLASDLWKTIRSKAFSNKSNSCKLCGELAQLLHHLDYSRKVLEGHDMSRLVPLCHECHKKVEFNENGTKRTMWQAVGMYNTFRKKLKEKAREDKERIEIENERKTLVCRACGSKLSKRHQNRACRNCKHLNQS